MRARSDVPPNTLAVDLQEGGVAIEYSDGREVFYHGVPDRTGSPLRTAPEVEVHVLVTDPTGTSGVLTYVNDRRTHDDVLESTGVGRVLLADGEREELFPGVVVRADGLRVVVDVDFDPVDGRVFVFEESELGERSREVVPADEAASTDESETGTVGAADGHDADGPAADGNGGES